MLQTVYTSQCVLQSVLTAPCVLQNALKVFANFPDSLMDIVRRTDPTTVTQHGLYMRPLADNPLFQYQPPASSESGKQIPATHPAAPQNSETAIQPQAQSLKSQSDTQERGQQQQIFGSSEPASPTQQKASGGKWEDWHQPGVASDSHQTDGGSKQQEVENWGRGRVTLLGDAAHATIPNGESLWQKSCWLCRLCHTS